MAEYTSQVTDVEEDRKIHKRALDVRNCGLEDEQVFHGWNNIIIFDSLGKYIMLKLDLFGHYTIRKGLLSMYSVIYPAIAIAILYAYYFYAGKERAFTARFILNV